MLFRSLEHGLDVVMVARQDAIGATLPYPPATVAAAKERLYSGAFDFVGGHHLISIEPGQVTVGVPFTERSRTIAANTVVLVTYNHPNRELADYLREEDGPWAVHLVGDVNGTNGILQAVHSAAAVARSI